MRNRVPRGLKRNDPVWGVPRGRRRRRGRGAAYARPSSARRSWSRWLSSRRLRNAASAAATSLRRYWRSSAQPSGVAGSKDSFGSGRRASAASLWPRTAPAGWSGVRSRRFRRTATGAFAYSSMLGMGTNLRQQAARAPAPCAQRTASSCRVRRTGGTHMGELIHVSKVRIVKDKGPLRRAWIENFPDPVVYGVHGGIKKFYGVEPEQE